VNGISKQKQKYIQSLHLKKYRQQFGAFIVEGQKSIEELAKSDFRILELFLTDKANELKVDAEQISYCTAEEIQKASLFKSNNYGIAVVVSKSNVALAIVKNEWVLALDDLNDPGNLGTIIRIADWYGIKKIICSESTVDFYNPKVISSSMGSFTRVSCFYTDLKTYLESNSAPIFGAYLDGANIHKIDFPSSGILIIGSESHGISHELENLVKMKITIPSFGQAESLNAGVATAIILDNINRF
jgi:TrmH family RNA methyltransferase